MASKQAAAAAFLLVLLCCSASSASELRRNHLKAYSSANISGPSVIGTSVFLHKIDLLNVLTQGHIVFTKDCAVQEENKKLHKSETYYRNTEEYLHGVETSAGISSTTNFVLSTTFKVAHNTKEANSLELKGYLMDIMSTAAVVTTKGQCFRHTEINPAMIAAFDALPVDVAKPDEFDSWDPYYHFFKAFGSHYISQVTYGSRVQVWESSESTATYTQRDFAIKACMDLQGPSPVGWSSVEACAGYSTEDRKTATSLNMQKRVLVRGGSDATRGKMSSGTPSAAEMDQFMSEGADAQTAQPIAYAFSPLWELLEVRAGGSASDKAKRAANMRDFHDGMLGFDCQESRTYRTAGVKKTVVLKKFELVSDSPRKYACMRPDDGCKDDDDCHIGGAGQVCYCYGPSCIRSNKKKEAEVQEVRTGSYDEGSNLSCSYDKSIWKFGLSFNCQCTRKGDRHAIYTAGH